MKKMVKIVMTLALLLSVLSTGVFAAEDEAVKGQGIPVSDSNAEDGIMPLYLYMSQWFCGLDKQGNNLVCTTSVEGYEGIVQEIRIEMTLQKKGLFFYSDIITWTDAFYADSATMVRYYEFESGAKYKLKSYIEVYHGSDFESDSNVTDPFPK